jgi:hypothetical protein
MSRFVPQATFSSNTAPSKRPQENRFLRATWKVSSITCPSVTGQMRIYPALIPGPAGAGAAAVRLRALPAVPREFGAGSISGLVARPGVSVDLTWDDSGALVSSELHALVDCAPVRICYRDQVTDVLRLAAHDSVCPLLRHLPRRTHVVVGGGYIRGDGAAGQCRADGSGNGR